MRKFTRCAETTGAVFANFGLKSRARSWGPNVELPDVAQCVLFSVPEPIWAEKIKAVLVPRPGITSDIPAHLDHCRERWAALKSPRYWEVRGDLPRTRTLKAAAGALRTAHQAHPGWDCTRAADVGMAGGRPT